MNLDKLKPWNCFRHEVGDSGEGGHLPVVRERSACAPASWLNLQREMDHWFDDALRSFGLPSLAFGPGSALRRTLALPDDAVADDIRAHFDKGVLRVEIPRRQGASEAVRRISIAA